MRKIRAKPAARPTSPASGSSSRRLGADGLLGNVGDIYPELLRRDMIPDALTDQTAAHDPLNGYIPMGMTFEEAVKLRTSDPQAYLERVYHTVLVHVRALLDFQKRGAKTFEYGNNLRRLAFDHGEEDAFNIVGYMPEYIRPLFCEGNGPFRWAALSGKEEDIYKTDEKVLELFPDNAHLKKWITLARERIRFQGLPSRICWLNYGQREKMGLAINEMVKKGEISAPIAIGRDHHDTGSVASPYRETEAMMDGSDAVSDWPLLNALLNTAGGATWVSLHHGGGVGMGYSQHAGMVIVAVLSASLAGYAGLILSFHSKVPSGPAIILAAAAIYAASLLFGTNGGAVRQMFPGRHLEA